MTRPTPPAWLLLLVLVPVAAGCFGRKSSPYVRITVASGRLYYAHMGRSLYSESGGFLTFRDLITREHVRLKNGTYLVAECSVEEIGKRQGEYIDDPTRPPHTEPP